MAKARGKIPERWSYDVFLSFRGEDVRKNFISHLYDSLKRSGIHTFKDDEELKRGKNISPALLEAIRSTRAHLVLLSKNYASSKWCLDELMHIMECRRNNPGHVVVPIFYNVDPSDVRRQSGPFGAYFSKHEARHPEKVQRWKEALTEVANLSGFVRENNQNEAELVNKITKEIRKMSSISYMQLPAYAVGIRPRVQDIYKLLCFGSDDAQIIGICGMGGIGKTTLAKAAYNQFSDRFEGTSFLENFGEYSKKPKGKDHLQRKLLSDITRNSDHVFNMDHAVKQRFRNRRVLVVIDDVEDVDQLASVGIDLSCFGPGSRIIITSRDMHLLELLNVEKIYSPNALNDEESLKLIRLHAFRTSEPSEGFILLSKKLAKYCGGLPLAMEVLGSFLFKRSISEWKSTLKSLKSLPNDNIQAKLEISFDALNAFQKDIFLDISCFFIGMDKDYVGCILDGCDLYPDIGLSVLKERCLITVHDNRLMMHNLLRDMGRHIVRRTSPKNCERWSRLWDPVDVMNGLTNYHGTDAIEGLSLKAEVTSVKNLEVKAFSNLTNLRLLQLSHVHLNGSYANFPNRLRWLCWLGFPLHSIPTDFRLGSLVVMDMQYSNLKRLWGDGKQPQSLKELKYLDLSHSIQLTDTPDFSDLPNLEKLLLINCKSLVRVHKSIGSLHQKLILLNLKDCTKLGDLPLELYMLKSLETLIVSGCVKLERLDNALRDMKSLTTLKADYTAITQIPSMSNQLEELSLDGCKELWKVRDNTHSDGSPQATLSLLFPLNGISYLKTLRLGSCNLSDELVPKNLGSLSCLEELDLQGNNFRNLQMDFAGLSSLQILKVDSCSELQSMFSLPKRLRSFYASNCIMLERTPDLSECSVLQSLHLTNCFNLVETPGLDKLKTVGVIHMEMCNRISTDYRESIMQGWAVGANGGIFIPGSSVPNWVSFKNERHSISFIVPGSLNADLIGFTLWVAYVSQQNDVMSGYPPKIIVNNHTKEDVWIRSPATDHIRMYHEKDIWQGHFSNEDFCLDTGDQVEVSVDFGDQFTILEIGLTLSYIEKDSNSSDEDVSDSRFHEIIDDELVLPESQRRPRKKQKTTILKADYTAITQIPYVSNQLEELSLDGCNELWKVRDNTCVLKSAPRPRLGSRRGEAMGSAPQTGEARRSPRGYRSGTPGLKARLNSLCASDRKSCASNGQGSEAPAPRLKAQTKPPSALPRLALFKTQDNTHSDGSPQATLSLLFPLNVISCLKTLRLGSCNLSDELVPKNLASLSCLEELDLQGNNFRNLQMDFAGLSSLQILKVDSCSELQSMVSLPKRLRSFYASNCIMLERTPDLSECSVLQSLHLTNCFNLVETPGLDKLKTVGVIHMEMCNRISTDYRESIMQGWAVGANGGIFIPGSSVPNWVSFKNERHSISFIVPGSLNADLIGFTLWVAYVSQQNDVMSGYPPKIIVNNHTKEDVWIRSPATDQIRMYHEKHIWQGHFSNEDFCLDTGDQVEVSVDFGDQFTILEIGLTLSYKEEDSNSSDEDVSDSRIHEIIDDEIIDDELVLTESQRRPRKKQKTTLLLFMMFVLLVIQNVYFKETWSGK